MGGSEYYYKSKKAGIYEEGPYQRQITPGCEGGVTDCAAVAGIGFLIRRFEIAGGGPLLFRLFGCAA